jgi:hypothetical protein
MLFGCIMELVPLIAYRWKKLDLPASLANATLAILLLEELDMEVANSNVSKFIIGGFQQHLGAPWGAADGWMLKLYWVNGRV